MTEDSAVSVSHELLDLYSRVCDGEASLDIATVEAELTRLKKVIQGRGVGSELALYDSFRKLFALRLPELKSELLCIKKSPQIQGIWSEQQQVSKTVPPICVRGRPGISLVTCSMNRSANLVRAMKSWISCPEVSEIVVVDWSSDRPVADEIRSAGIFDARVRVIRVENEPRWILSYAFNLGFRFAQYENILKVDADIIIDPAFFERTILAPGYFFAGNWRTAAEGQAYVNGFFYVHRSDLAAVGGFNEYIRTYGWDDDDIYGRLESHGARRLDLDQSLIEHLPHSDEERTGAVKANNTNRLSAIEELQNNTLFLIRRNRFLANVMPVWKDDSPSLPFIISDQTTQGLHVCRSGEEPCPVSEHIFSDASFYALLELTAWRLGRKVWELSPEQLKTLLSRPFSEISKDDVNALLNSCSQPVYSPSLAPSRARLFIDAQHGLGNRMRAIGSAAAIALRTDRELVIVWQPDHHCEARFSDLFDYTGAVIEQSFVSDAVAKGCEVFNYMPTERGAQKNAVIDTDLGRDIYARAAFVLNSPHSAWNTENLFIQQLRPVEAIRALVDTVRNPNQVSAHIRMEAGAGLDHNSYDRPENWGEEDHRLIHEWRAKSHFEHFMTRIDALTRQGRAERIFVAADRPETYEEFKARYGDRVAFLRRTAYDRSAEQLRYAMADAILLSRAPLMLGSTWSSFSELAMRLAPGGIDVEMSGKDF
jgi:GT2 family glycosyltransferase